MVPHFHVPQFSPVQTGAANSCLAFSVAPFAAQFTRQNDLAPKRLRQIARAKLSQYALDMDNHTPHG